MSEFLAALIVAWLAAWLTSEGIKAGEPYKIGKIAVPLVKECEAKLPRDQICIIIAIPKETKDD